MISTIKDLKSVLRYYASKISRTFFIFFLGAVLAYFFACIRYEEQLSPVTIDYIDEHLSSQGWSVFHLVVPNQPPTILTEADMGDCYISENHGTLKISRIYEIEFKKPIRRQAFLTLISYPTSDMSKIILHAFDNRTALLEISTSTLCSVLQFQQNWRVLFKEIDTCDQVFFSKLHLLAGEENFRRSVVPFPELNNTLARILRDGRPNTGDALY